MALLLEWGTKMKNYLIAFGVLILGVLAAVFIGEKKQQVKDAKAAGEVVDKTLTKIAATSKQEQSDAADNPATGPDSSASQLRDDWSE
jgi:hypothetical protein